MERHVTMVDITAGSVAAAAITTIGGATARQTDCLIAFVRYCTIHHVCWGLALIHMCAPQITSIVFIERMIMPPAGHGPATIQKFVATVGCDNLVHLFRDIPEESVCVFNASRASSGPI